MDVAPAPKQAAIELLERLIATPSFSQEEGDTARLLDDFFAAHGHTTEALGHNRWLRTAGYDPGRPTVLLNSHHDTVRPVEGWQRDPFQPTREDGRLYGMGSNDAGGALVSLAATFLHFAARDDLPFNLFFLASAEEEISGRGGVEAALPALGPIDLGIVGEPTRMRLATAEKGLMVLDGLARGEAGHAARGEGVNALYRALDDVQKLRDLDLPLRSATLGAVRINVTQIEAGTQHNVVPDRCRFVVDVRTTDRYPNVDALRLLRAAVASELTPRSTRLNPSGLPDGHPLRAAAADLGLETFGSATLSDQALMPFPTAKIGPGDSPRSHTADEYIELAEIEAGIDGYIQLIDSLARRWPIK